MRIVEVAAFVVKSSVQYKMGGDSFTSGGLPCSEYLRFHPYPQLYSERSEALIVKITTDDGFVGWGECQAPIGPEVAQTIIRTILGPAILGKSALENNLRFTEMYETLRVRGQVTGFQMDAIAGIDTALWDIKGKALRMSVSALLGGRYRETLKTYKSALHRKTRAERLEEARGYVASGIAGIKTFSGYGLKDDTEEIVALREALGPDAVLMVDGVWKYGFHEAVKLGRVLEECGVEFFESPLVPEDIRGHARLARELDVAIAVGEPLRTRFQFHEWFLQDALDVCQPDVMRNGISESFKIAAVAESFNKPVAFHTGTLTVVGMAATFHSAAAIPNFLIQEYQPSMLETFNAWLEEPLSLRDGELVVPSGPGLGIDIIEEKFAEDVDSAAVLRLPALQTA